MRELGVAQAHHLGHYSAATAIRTPSACNGESDCPRIRNATAIVARSSIEENRIVFTGPIIAMPTKKPIMAPAKSRFLPRKLHQPIVDCGNRSSPLSREMTANEATAIVTR